MKKFFLIMLASAATLGSAAFNVSTVPGGIADAIDGHLDETSLEVNGYLNAADLEYIATNMKNLETLDLSNLSGIVAYEGEPLATGRTNAAASEIPEYAFFGSSVKTVLLPTTVTAIRECAFAGSGITSIEIPASCTEIDSRAFLDCASLQSVSFCADALLGTETFAGCSSLSTVTGCEKLTNIGCGAFKGCSSLQSFNFSEALNAIGSEAFAKSGLKAVNLANVENLTSLPQGVFAECDALTSIALPDGVAAIENGALFGDAAVTTFNFPSELSIIGDYALYGLENLTFPVTTDINAVVGGNTQITSIGKYAMANMKAMKQFSFPASTDFIGDYAMANWTSVIDYLVRNITVAPVLGENVWSGVNQPSVYLFVTQQNDTEFSSKEQWKEFNFTYSTTSNEGIYNDQIAKADIAAWIDGTIINILANGDIRSVNVYDTTGRLLTSVADCGENAQIDTDMWQCRLFIVRVTLADGTSSAVKLARR